MDVKISLVLMEYVTTPAWQSAIIPVHVTWLAVRQALDGKDTTVMQVSQNYALVKEYLTNGIQQS